MGQQVVRVRQLSIRCTPWKWLQTRVERLLTPISFEAVSADKQSSRPEELEFHGARSPVGADDSVITDQASIDSRRCESTVLKLCNGRSIRVRPVRPSDVEQIQEFVRRLSDTSRRRRFFAPIRELTPTMLAHLTGSPGRHGPVLVAEAHEDQVSRILALAEYATGDDNETCELALVVADAWQRLGLGHALMGMLIQAAREARYVRAVADVLHGNEAMVALGRAHDFAIASSPLGSTMLRLVRDLEGPASTTKMRNAAGDTPRLIAAFAVS